MSLLSVSEIEAVLKIGEGNISDYPEINLLIPAIEDHIKIATGKDWASDNLPDPLAKMVASILLVRWHEDPGMIGKSNDAGLIGLIAQLQAKVNGGI